MNHSKKLLFWVIKQNIQLLNFLTLDVTSELSGGEDPIFLYPVVLNWSVKGAVKEGR